MNKISIIIPIRNEENYIKDCIESIISFEYSKEYLEVIFVDGMSTDNTIEIIKEYQKKYKYIKVLNNPDKIVPISMNIAIKNSIGEYICRLDAHAKYPTNYICKLLEWSKKLDADNVGTVCLTDIKKKTNVAKSIQFVMSDKFGVGNSLFRTGIDKPLEVDTVPFGFFKRTVFDKVGLYDHRLVRTQDLELNKRIVKNGGKIYLISDVKCTYYPRENIFSFFKNRFQTGRWVILSPYLTNSLKSISIRHMVPLFFTLSLLLGCILSFVDKSFLYILSFIVLSYILILGIHAFKIKKSFILSFYILFAYFILHISYGLGSLKGLLEVILKKKRKNI